MERLPYDLGYLRHVQHQVVVLGDGDGDAGDVRLLEAVAPDEGANHGPRYTDQGHGVHPGVGDAGDDVGRAGAGGSEAHPYLARYAGVGVGGVGRALLVLHQVVAYLRVVLGNRIVEGQVGPAGDTEDVLGPLPDQRLHHHLGSCQLRHDYTPPDTIRLISVTFIP